MRYSRFSKVVYTVLLFSSMSIFATGKELNAQENKAKYSEQIILKGFTLEDVNEVEHNLSDLENNVVVLITSTKESRETTKKWMNEFKQSFNEQDSIGIVVLVNDVSERPFFIPKSKVLEDIRKNNENSLKKKNFLLLIDWDMKASSVLKASADNPKIFLFDRMGKLHYRISASFSDKKAKQIVKRLSSMLTGN